MARIELRQVSKREWGGFVLQQMELDADHGEIVMLLDPQGQASTTLLKLLSGRSRPSSGTLSIDGERSPHRLSRLGGIERLEPIRWSQGRANAVSATLRPLLRRGHKRRTAEAMTQEALERLRLGPLQDEKLHRLCAEDRARVSLARAIAGRPSLILAQNPFAELPESARLRLSAQFRRLVSELGVTVIAATDDPGIAMGLGDRIAVFEAAALVQIGTPPALCNHPESAKTAALIGRPAMNLLSGHLRGGIFRGLNVLVEGLDGPDGPAILGFRPEAAQIVDAHMGFTGCEIAGTVHSHSFDGHSPLLFVEAGGTYVAIPMDQGPLPTLGTPVRIVVPPDQCHVFDAQSGARIGGPMAAEPIAWAF